MQDRVSDTIAGATNSDLTRHSHNIDNVNGRLSPIAKSQGASDDSDSSGSKATKRSRSDTKDMLSSSFDNYNPRSLLTLSADEKMLQRMLSSSLSPSNRSNRSGQRSDDMSDSEVSDFELSVVEEGGPNINAEDDHDDVNEEEALVRGNRTASVRSLTRASSSAVSNRAEGGSSHSESTTATGNTRERLSSDAESLSQTARSLRRDHG